MAIAASIITVMAQQAGEAVGTTEAFPLPIRFETALVSYANYLLDVIWPFRLAVFYPHPRQLLPAWELALAALPLFAVTALSVWSARKQRYVLVGWLWFLGTLVPVIGSVQVGLQSRADRYAYIPLIGIFISVVWYAGEWGRGRPLRPKSLAVISADIVITFTIVTRLQSSYWQNSVQLFQRALAVTENNYVAHNNLGEVYAQQGRFDEAGLQFAAALERNPMFAHSRHNNLRIHTARSPKPLPPAAASRRITRC